MTSMELLLSFHRASLSVFLARLHIRSSSRSGSWRATKTVSLQTSCSRPRVLLAVLRDTVAKRPIFFLNFDQINEDIFRTNAKYRMELVGDLLVQTLLLFEGASFIQGDLNYEKAVRALHVQIGGIIDQAGGIVLSNHLKMVIFRNMNGGAHSLVDDISHLVAKVRWFPLHQRDSNEWHCSSFLSRRREVIDHIGQNPVYRLV